MEAVEFPDMMVDVETTGNDNPSVFGCFQVSAIKFNARTGAVGPMFDRCPGLLPNRYWTGDTQHFWMVKNRAVYDKIVAREEPAVKVWEDFRAFAMKDAPNGGYRFWAKPITFDWAVVASHFHQLGLSMPFHFRFARDLNTYMAALAGGPEHTNMEAVIPFEGDQHNGLHDCAYQIDMLMHCVRRHVHAEVSA